MRFVRQAYWIALCVYHEARGEPVEGQIGVAHVIITRAAKRRTSVVEAIKRKHQFSWYWDKLPDDVTDHEAFIECMESTLTAMEQRLQGITMDGADHYHADYVHPDWAEKMHEVARIGRHVFYRA